MRRVMANLIYSKARLMVVLRGILIGLIVFMGLARLRIIIMLLASPANNQDRDILQEYLMAKALVTGVNPYLPLNRLATMFIGQFPFLTHPAPHPPFIAILATPLSVFNLNQVITVWFIIELACLMAIAWMLVVLWKGKVDWVPAILIFFLLLAWYPVMVDLLYGQLTILLTTLLLAALLALRSNKKVLAGVLIGLSVAIKMYTWPLIIYFALKKDWRTFISSITSLIGFNLLALTIMGIGPFSDYFLHVTMQVSAIYHSFLKNYSLWSIGYRFFDGTRPIGGNFISAPPLVSMPQLAPFVSAALAALFLIAGLILATRSSDINIAYAIMICVIVAVSPISWDHYYIMIVISLAILLQYLVRLSFPSWSTAIFLFIVLLLFLFNDHIADVMFLLNGGIGLVQARENQISFASSLLEILPVIQIIILTFLLWQIGASTSKGEQVELVDQQ
jgi:Glycosyltransferase family 87